MEEYTLVESSFSATINAPIEKVDIPSLVFFVARIEISGLLASSLFGRCNHGARRSAHVDQRRDIRRKPDGAALPLRRLRQSDHLRLVSNSDLFTPSGRTKLKVIATPKLLNFLVKQGIPWDVFRTGRKPISEAHSYDIALAAHESEAYQKALQALGSGAERDYRIVEGA